MNCRVALFIYSCPFQFPPVIHAANILAEQGLPTHLIGVRYKVTYEQKLSGNVGLYFAAPNATGVKGMVQYLLAFLRLRNYLKKEQITVLISYDAKSVLPAWFATRFTNTKWYYHQHDFWERPASISEKLIWKSEYRLARKANKISFPQIERAEIFKARAGLNTMPVIVHNGPRLNWQREEPLIHPVMEQFKNKFRYVLIYQGGWAAHFALERIFDALALCKQDVCLIMLGEERKPGVRNSYINHLAKLGLSNRVYLAESYLPYDELPRFTKFADAAIGILTREEDEAPVNNRYLVGASNKICEYVAFGLPVLLENSAPNRRFFDRYPIGLLVNSTDSAAFAKKIDGLLSDHVKRNQIAAYNRRLFAEELNFDTQFRKLFSIDSDCDR